MDPAIVFFGFGVGFLVGLTGMGGGSLMTPLLILVFGIKPMTAIGTDIFYAAVTKTAGGWRHLKLKTVNMPLTFWMAGGSVPPRSSGSGLSTSSSDRLGDDLDETVFAILASCLLVVGSITLLRSLFLANKIDRARGLRDPHPPQGRRGRDRRHHRLRDRAQLGRQRHGDRDHADRGLPAHPQRVVGTDVFHAAILLWAAGIAHIFGGNVDFGLAANILVGSVPGVILGSNMSVKWPQGILRTALGVVLIAAGMAMLEKANTDLVPYALGFAAVSFAGLFGIQYAPAPRGRGRPGRAGGDAAGQAVAVMGDEVASPRA